MHLGRNRDCFEEDSSSDATLLLRLRGGDQQAYVSLWKRHVDAALRLAWRLMPGRAEDLVSESFLAVYEQVTQTDKGPDSAFRAYLFTVMRNKAVRWLKEANKVQELPEIVEADLDDGPYLVERDAQATELLAAFQELPERWQRVLWLSEIEGVSRPKIAAELGVKPNAVSSLQRRARAGLRLEWLTQQVPKELREDPAHVAYLLPQFVLGQVNDAGAKEIRAHLPDCAACSDSLNELQPLAARVQKTTIFTAGFAALAVAIPAATPLQVGAAVGGAAVIVGASTGLATGGGIAVGGIGTLVIGGLLVTALVSGVPGSTKSPSGDDKQSTGSTESLTTSGEKTHKADPDTLGTEGTVVDTGDSTPNNTAQLGRHNTDPSIEVIDLPSEPDYSRDSLPRPPVPVEPGQLPDPSPDPTPLDVGVTTPPLQHGYIPPVIQGLTEPGAMIAIESVNQSFRSVQYTTQAGPDGTWAYDMSSFRWDRISREYAYTVWAYTDTMQSEVYSSTFTLEPVVVRGFEPAEGEAVLTLEAIEARTTGVVIAITGPANGTIEIDSMVGQRAVFTLDNSGTKVLRMRLNSRGWYMLNFRVLSDSYQGPNTEIYAEVFDPEIIFDPFGPDPSEQTFSISEA